MTRDVGEERMSTSVEGGGGVVAGDEVTVPVATVGVVVLVPMNELE